MGRRSSPRRTAAVCGPSPRRRSTADPSSGGPRATAALYHSEDAALPPRARGARPGALHRVLRDVFRIRLLERETLPGRGDHREERRRLRARAGPGPLARTRGRLPALRVRPGLARRVRDLRARLVADAVELVEDEDTAAYVGFKCLDRSE